MDDIKLGLFSTLGSYQIHSLDGHNDDGNPHQQYITEVRAPLFVNTQQFSLLPTLLNECLWLPNQRAMRLKLNLYTNSEITANTDVLTINYHVQKQQLFPCLVSKGGIGYLRINDNKLRLIVGSSIPAEANISADIEIRY